MSIYTILEDESMSALIRLVNAAIADGWQPHGSPGHANTIFEWHDQYQAGVNFQANGGREIWWQAMVKPKPPVS